MTRDEIIRMAQEAGFVPHYTRPQDAIVRNGYALSAELKRYKAWMLNIERLARAAYAAGAAAEREACAKVCYDAEKSTHPTDLGDAILAREAK